MCFAERGAAMNKGKRNTVEMERTFGPRRVALVALGLLALLLGLSFSSSTARADPIERDCFASSTGEITIETPLGPDTVDLHAVPGKPTRVEVDLGSLGDTSDECPSPGAPDLPNGLQEVHTRIVSMELTGFSNALLSDVIIRVPQAPHPGVESVGQIEENENAEPGRLDLPGGEPPFCGDPAPPNCVGKTACSFFDVFFEVEVVNSPYLPPSIKLHNNDPKRLEATITHKPPATGETYESPAGSWVQLFDESENPTPVYVVAAKHTPGPPCGVGGTTELHVDGADPTALQADDTSGASARLYAALAGGAAAALAAVLAGGWYVRRRWVR